jgi:uncharacterized repeat protein (TIGR03803 family)
LLLVAGEIAFSSKALALPITALYSFCSQTNCTDGSKPNAALLMDSSGNLYGSAYAGGTNRNGGVIFELTPAGNGRWRYHLVHTFCTENYCPDAGSPIAPLIIDAAGNLYGTTSGGYSGQPGVVFELIPNRAHTRWKFKVLYEFGQDTSDGKHPGWGALTYAGASSGAVYDGSSPLFGVTNGGGSNGYGTAFELTRTSRGGWRETVLHNFCLQPCADGQIPEGGLTLDGKGNLYGTTVVGGVNNGGTVFELTPDGTGKWNETVLYSFCSQTDCADGADPYATLIMDAAGSLFGTAAYGGANNQNGVVFKLTPNGPQYQYSIVYSFCGQANCADGARPVGGLLMNAKGTLFGTALLGGIGNGTAFAIDSGFQVLHSFRVKQGAVPASGLIFDGAGNLLGTATEGGANNYGAVFELKR